VIRLAALLRVADGFDRGHVAAVEKLKVKVAGGAVRIRPYPRRMGDDMRLERWGASRKSGLLQSVSGLSIEIAGGPGELAVDGERVE
jgi:exopolyphosphatase/guanosine-5'-triphosphate,3'-diphosphate pyrophosphatase